MARWPPKCGGFHYCGKGQTGYCGREWPAVPAIYGLWNLYDQAPACYLTSSPQPHFNTVWPQGPFRTPFEQTHHAPALEPWACCSPPPPGCRLPDVHMASPGSSARMPVPQQGLPWPPFVKWHFPHQPAMINPVTVWFSTKLLSLPESISPLFCFLVLLLLYPSQHQNISPIRARGLSCLFRAHPIQWQRVDAQ